MLHVFISYCHQRKAIVKTLAQDIKAIGHTPWFDHELSGGQTWWDQILAKIRECDVFVFVLDREALNSTACMREFDYAEALRKRILPILVAKGVSTNRLPPRLSKINFVDYRKLDRDSAFELCKALSNIEPPGPLPDPLPTPPEVPIPYLGSLAEQIETKSTLTHEKQGYLVVELKRSLRDPETTTDVRALLKILRKRRDLFAPIAEEIDELLKRPRRRHSTTPEHPLTRSEVTKDALIQKESLIKEMRDRMVEIPAGKFTMGDAHTGQVEVTISHPFLIDKYPVTQALYSRILNKNPSHFKGETLPVENVSWFDAVEFCNELSKQSDLVPVYEVSGKKIIINYKNSGYRLPTEAEWEYACHGNTKGERYGELNVIACYRKNSRDKTEDVGHRKANELGLYDMLGNVWEWCNDWYKKEYPKKPQIDPTGPTEGFERLLRGGSWANFENNIKSSYRNRKDPYISDDTIGFRLARTLD